MKTKTQWKKNKIQGERKIKSRRETWERQMRCMLILRAVSAGHLQPLSFNAPPPSEWPSLTSTVSPGDTTEINCRPTVQLATLMLLWISSLKRARFGGSLNVANFAAAATVKRRTETRSKNVKFFFPLCEQWDACSKCHAIKCHTSLCILFPLPSLFACKSSVPGWGKNTKIGDFFLPLTRNTQKNYMIERNYLGYSWFKVDYGAFVLKEGCCSC